MKKLLGIAVLGLLLLNSCMQGAPLWIMTATHEELTSHYSKMGIDEICHKWKESEYDIREWRTKKRNAMKEAIARKNEDPLFCMKVENP